MERVYIIPLRDVKRVPRTIRSPKAVRLVREFLQKHMKSDDIKIDSSVNEKDMGERNPKGTTKD